MMITQYYPNPLFRNSGAKHVQQGNGTMTYEYGSENRYLNLSSADDTGMQCSLNLKSLPPAGTRMVFSIGTFITSGATKFRNGCLAVFGFGDGGWTAVAKVGSDYAGHVGTTHNFVTEFVMPVHESPLQLVFNSPSIANESVTFDNPKLMTKDDWTRYQAMEDKPAYVYWDLMTPTRG